MGNEARGRGIQTGAQHVKLARTDMLPIWQRVQSIHLTW